jgi:hypothetical protein
MPAVALPVDPGDIHVDAVRDRYRLSALGPDHAVGLLAERAAQLRECVTEAGARAVLAHIRPQPAGQLAAAARSALEREHH